VIAFNAAEGWSRDVSEDIALEIRKSLPDPQRPPRLAPGRLLDYSR
jgi:hypothetical protein